MPVTGTPAQGLPESVCGAAQTAPCSDQNRLSPEVSQYYGSLLLSRMRSVRGRVGQHMKIVWTLSDHAGHPIDLTACGFSAEPESSQSSSSTSSSSTSSSSTSESSESAASSEASLPRFVFRIRENLSLGFSLTQTQTGYSVHLEDAATGRVRIELPSTATQHPGVYFAKIAVVSDQGLILFTNVFYVIIERGQFGDGRWTGGPPTIAEIRLHLRDSSPSESLLLDNIRFDDAEIALAISRPIDYWNEAPPPVGPRMTTRNFPHRFHWMEAIVANLFWMLEEHQRANNLTYSAAGVQVNDHDREVNYARAAERRWGNFVAFVRNKKAALNLDQCYGGIGGSRHTSRRYY